MLPWQLVCDETTDDSWRLLGLEMVILLAENGKRTIIANLPAQALPHTSST